MYKVLIADDEPIEREVVSRTLMRNYQEQIEIIHAVNGRDAIAMFQKHNCEIAILDIEMPGINGLEAAEEIRKKDETCSIIFLTAFDEFSYAKKAISVKALDYLLKPSADEELIAVMDEALRLATRQVRKSDHLNYKRITEKSNMIDLKMNAAQKLILEFIQENYAADIALQDVASALHYSDVYFCKIFKQCFDQNFTSYLAEYRIKQAKRLLKDITVNVKEISEKVGYQDSNYFAKVFKRLEGKTPSEYRLEYLGRSEVID